MIPELTKGGIDRYVRDGCMPGSFVRAVLENNLKEAFARADEGNTREMFSIVDYCWNHIPSGCWGSPKAVSAWLEAKREAA